MSDLNKLNAAATVKIAGADPVTGLETFFADVTSEGELKISSFANVDFQAANKTITGTESLASVGVGNLSNRKSLVIFNRGAQSIFYGPTGVTSATGIEIEKDELIVLEVGDNIGIYLVSASGSPTATVQEFS